MWRLLAFAMSVCALAACLMSIDESKIDYESNDGRRRDASVTPDVSPTNPTPAVRDAEAPTILEDGGRVCSEGLTLCPDDICYDTTGELSHCGSCNFKCAPNQVCRASKCIPPGSCKELLARDPGTATGLTNLTIDGKVRPAYCDMSTDGGGFTLVFRLSADQPGDPYKLFMGGPINDESPAEVTPQVRNGHYVSRLLAGWNAAFPVEQVRVRLFDGFGGVLRELSFNGKGSTRESWFAKDKVLSSPWTDLGDADVGFFAPRGHGGDEDYKLQRRFFVHRPYNTCEEDHGWLVVHGGPVELTPCPYENPSSKIRIFFAPGTTAHKWATGVSEAKSFAVFAR